MTDRVREFFRRHPIVRDALLWAIPAILVGGFLRALLLSYLPYAYWGSDSRSYFSFAHKLLTEGYLSLDEKRRYLYPIFCYFVAWLPGSTLKWVAWVQHAFGLLTLVPLAYIVRTTFAHWRWWVVPVTLIYGCMPLLMWYEHELLAEALFYATIVWAWAGWNAWVRQAQPARAQRIFWFFFGALALFLLLKPSARLVWPGIAAGILFTGAWRVITRPQWIALGVLIIVSATFGSKNQRAWLLYTSVFPLTQLDSPKHAELKAEIRPFVESFQGRLPVYYREDDEPFEFLANPEKYDKEAGRKDRPLWYQLGKDDDRKRVVYSELAREAVQANPYWIIHFGLQRAVAGANPSNFKESGLDPNTYGERFREHYDRAVKDKKDLVRILFGGKRGEAAPPFETIAANLAKPGWAADQFRAFVDWYHAHTDLVVLAKGGDVAQRAVLPPKFTPLGWWVVLSALLAFLPFYFRTLGIWTLVLGGYLFLICAVGQTNVRYLAPVYPALVMYLFLLPDSLARWLRRRPATQA